MQPSFDKQFVRNWLTGPESGWDRASDTPPPPLPQDIVDATRARYIEAYERISACRSRTGWAEMTMPSTPTTPPVAKRVPFERTHHGDTFVDHYEWLRAKEDPEVIAYLEAENAYTAQQLEHLEPLREKVFQEIKSRTQETDMSVPTRLGDWWYYARTIEGKQYGVNCRCPIAGPDDWTPPELSTDTAIEASRCSSTATPRPRDTTSSRWARSRSVTTARCSRTRWT